MDQVAVTQVKSILEERSRTERMPQGTRGSGGTKWGKLVLMEEKGRWWWWKSRTKLELLELVERDCRCS